MLKSYTRQAVFEKVVSHLFSQGAPSLFNGSCAYRGAFGTMCAAGVLLPDSEVTVENNKGVAWENLSEGRVCPNVYCPTAITLSLTPHMTDLIVALQGAHDHSLTLSEGVFRQRLSIIANTFNLDSAFISGLTFNTEAYDAYYDAYHRAKD